MKSILIKDTTRDERIEIIKKSLSACGGDYEFSSEYNSMGGGRMDTLYQPYIDGLKEISEINAECAGGTVKG